MIPALRALWAGGWVEYHGPFYDVAAMRMEPSPSAPVPIYGGGHSAPAMRRAAELCDGWIAAGAYSVDDAKHYLTELHETRRRVGTDGRPFSVFLSLWDRPDVDVYRRFEEEYAVSDFLCAPGLTARVDPGADPAAQLRSRLDASARFAERIVAKAG
jgi:alkanesulfonate monooxygenase SsuD/methylene tetrahydromethanopterin reductase-like flavin-dependent oxidoreductase (luciferase family)